MRMEKLIYEFAEKEGLAVGITATAYFEELRPILVKENSELKGFAEQDIEKRIDPSLTMADVKSIIVLAMGYNKKVERPEGSLRGRFSVGAIGTDYHKLLKEELENLEHVLKEADDEIRCLSFVDTGPLVDRYTAVRSGLGYIGKNGCIHTQKLGSMVFIGYMLVNQALEGKNIYGVETADDCKDCDKCLRVCPSGALTEKGFHMKRCISYLTQTKEVLSREEMRLVGLQLYGCDVCQKACHHNGVEKADFFPHGEEAMPLLSDILHMTNKEFRDTIGKTAAGWRGKKIIQRNAVVALSNTRNREGLPLLAEALSDSRELIRHTAIRSIANLGMAEGIALLENAKEQETNEDLIMEMEEIIKELGR